MKYIIFGGFPEGGRVAERRSASPLAQRFVRWLRFHQRAKLELSSLFREQLGGGQELNGAYPSSPLSVKADQRPIEGNQQEQHEKFHHRKAGAHAHEMLAFFARPW